MQLHFHVHRSMDCGAPVASTARFFTSIIWWYLCHVLVYLPNVRWDQQVGNQILSHSFGLNKFLHVLFTSEKANRIFIM